MKNLSLATATFFVCTDQIPTLGKELRGNKVYKNDNGDFVSEYCTFTPLISVQCINEHGMWFASTATESFCVFC